MRRRSTDTAEWTCPHCDKVCRGDAVISTHRTRCSRRRREKLHTTNVGPSISAFASVQDYDTSSDDSDDHNVPHHEMYDAQDLSLDSDDESEEDHVHALHFTQGPEICEDMLGIVTEGSRTSDMNDILHSFHIIEDQRRAALYIITAGKSSNGLSIKMTDFYLKTLPIGCDATQLWPTGIAFWEDHAIRQKSILPMIGGWKKVRIPPVSHSSSYMVPDYVALIRDLPSTIKHVVEGAKYLKLENGKTWSDCIKWDPIVELDSYGHRIVHDFYTSDDFIYTEKALRKDSGLNDAFFLPIQLFIDKANVTRLNKRSMYPVVLYLLCFPGQIRRKLAVNVAFIPVVTAVSKSGGHLSSALTKLVRRSAVQSSLSSLLSPLKRSQVLTATFPDNSLKEFIVLLVSFVADLPEAATLMSMRYGLKAYFPCFRCYTKKECLDFIPQSAAKPRTASNTASLYETIDELRTKADQELKLKQSSLSLPRSALLERFELNLDETSLYSGLRMDTSVLNNYQPFGLPSLIKFESLHNFDLGITADILRAIESYFSLFLTSGEATSIVNAANAHQSRLPRRSDSSMFRLPASELTIAPSHANVNAMQYRSALCVLTFLLRGSDKALSTAAEAMFNLLEFILSY